MHIFLYFLHFIFYILSKEFWTGISTKFLSLSLSVLWPLELDFHHCTNFWNKWKSRFSFFFPPIRADSDRAEMKWAHGGIHYMQQRTLWLYIMHHNHWDSMTPRSDCFIRNRTELSRVSLLSDIANYGGFCFPVFTVGSNTTAADIHTPNTALC